MPSGESALSASPSAVSAGGALPAPAATAVLLLTHYVDPGVLRGFRRLRAGCPPGHRAAVLLHLPDGPPVPDVPGDVPLHVVRTSEIRDRAYPAKSGGEGWSLWAGGHIDLVLLRHRKASAAPPDFYWVVEHDVRFSGDWGVLFRAFAGNDADLLSTTLRRAPADPAWPYWQTLVSPGPLGAGERIASFSPVFRASRRSLDAIDAAYRDGWGGHFEAAWPTILAKSGLRIEDIGGDGEFVGGANRNRFYENTPGSWDLSPGTLVFRPARLWPGLRRDRLWHPVKPLREKLLCDAARFRRAWRDRVASPIGRLLNTGA